MPLDQTHIDSLTISELADQDAGTLAILLDELAAQSAALDARKTKVAAAIERRYGDAMRKAFANKQTDTGTIHLIEAEYDIEIVVPKTVTWNAAILRPILDAMPPEDAKHYAKVEIAIDERKYLAAPVKLQKLLSPARTVKPGKPKFKLSSLKKEAA